MKGVVKRNVRIFEMFSKNVRKDVCGMYCGNCGKKMDDDKLVCSECGWQAKSAVSLKKSSMEKFFQRINIEKWALIGAVVCVGLAVVFEGLMLIEAKYNNASIMPGYYIGLALQVLALSFSLITMLMGDRVKCKKHVIIILLCQVILVIMNYVSTHSKWFQYIAVQLGIKETTIYDYSAVGGPCYKYVIGVSILLVPILMRSKKCWKVILILMTILLDVEVILDYRSILWKIGPGLYGLALWINWSLGGLAWLATYKVFVYFWMWWLARREKREGNTTL